MLGLLLCCNYHCTIIVSCQYKTISVPTLIVWGLDDEVIPVRIGSMLHEAIPLSRLELINDCGHVPQEETPEKIVPLILDFLLEPRTPRQD